MELECPVCFNNNELVNLECLHPLCKGCLRKLQKRNCPLCRFTISLAVYESVSHSQSFLSNKQYQEQIKSIKIKSRRGKRRIERVFPSVTSGTRVFFETEGEFDECEIRGRPNPNKCERKKRGKWANMSHNRYGSRFNNYR